MLHILLNQVLVDFCCSVTGNFTVCICVGNLLEQGLLFCPPTTFPWADFVFHNGVAYQAVPQLRDFNRIEGSQDSLIQLNTVCP